MTIIALIATALQAAQPLQRPPDLFDLLEGEWACRQEMLAGGPVFRRERWRSQEDGRVVGEIRSVPPRADGTALPPEAELVFSRQGRVPRLTYRPAGGRPVYYRLARGTRDEAVFEAVGNGSPRIISYRVGALQRLEVMHGLANGGSRRWTYRPQGMRSAVPRCDS
ncbi:MAG TPA: hypothetical protein VMG08_02090 [Allosphingosinicella sp.]|nr:hypothetical protein [Allosphingosinicella sp.]